MVYNRICVLLALLFIISENYIKIILEWDLSAINLTEEVDVQNVNQTIGIDYFKLLTNYIYIQRWTT